MAGYTAHNIRWELEGHPKHGSKFRFLFSQFRKRRIFFEVEDLWWFRKFDGEIGRISIDDGAFDLREATDWAIDGIREWAGKSISYIEGLDRTVGRSGNADFSLTNAFPFITREWAKDGPGNDDVPTCLGSTLDWLFLFSRNASRNGSMDMYEVFIERPIEPKPQDLFNIYCWVFAGKWAGFDKNLGQTTAMVNKVGNQGLHPDYWDSELKHKADDQTHHFAGYFWLGAQRGGNSKLAVDIALARTGDWDIKNKKEINRGDVLLGRKAAEWGSKMRDKPGFLGEELANDLRR